MKILMVNDDGVYSDGIVLLAEALARRGNEVTVCAPAENQSAASHSITLRSGFFAEELNFPNRLANYYAVEAKPVDCVQFALLVLKLKPDLIISGINNGMNLGSDVIYSGTVGAACEGAFCGIKAWAVSVFYQDRGKNYSFQPAIDFILDNFEKLFCLIKDSATFLNINIPVHQPIQGLKICKLAKCKYNILIEKTGNNIYRFNGLPIDFNRVEKESDLYYACKNYATVTPLSYDMTDYSALREIKI